jgi:hypothetical protein
MAPTTCSFKDIESTFHTKMLQFCLSPNLEDFLTEVFRDYKDTASINAATNTLTAFKTRLLSILPRLDDLKILAHAQALVDLHYELKKLLEQCAVNAQMQTDWKKRFLTVHAKFFQQKDIDEQRSKFLDKEVGLVMQQRDACWDQYLREASVRIFSFYFRTAPNL